MNGSVSAKMLMVVGLSAVGLAAAGLCSRAVRADDCQDESRCVVTFGGDYCYKCILATLNGDNVRVKCLPQNKLAAACLKDKGSTNSCETKEFQCKPCDVFDAEDDICHYPDEPGPVTVWRKLADCNSWDWACPPPLPWNPPPKKL